MKDYASVDDYLADLEDWRPQAEELRGILLGCGLDEAIKWGKPCYVFEGSNIAIIQPFKDFLALMFFKGALIEDHHGLLEEQGENTRSALRVRFTDAEQVVEREAILKEYVENAIEVEKAGLSVPKPDLVLVEELRNRLDEDPELKAAFEALTPGRQRGYNLYFSDAKQAKTRAARVARCVPKILAGKGLQDR